MDLMINGYCVTKDASRHVVQFFEDGQAHYDALTDFCYPPLTRNEGVLPVVTAEHGRVLKSRLRRMGLNVEGARACGQLRVADAVSMLDSIMVKNTLSGWLMNLRFFAAIAVNTSRVQKIRDTSGSCTAAHVCSVRKRPRQGLYASLAGLKPVGRQPLLERRSGKRWTIVVALNFVAPGGTQNL